MAARPKRRIDFGKLNWRKKSPGAPEKRYARNGRVIRLVRFTDEFVDKKWCQKGHVGMVLSGRLVLDFGTEQIEYKAGDVMFINSGDQDKHKTVIAEGEEATVLLFED